MVRHEAPRPNADIGGVAMLDQQVFVERTVLGREKHFGAAVASLRHVVRQVGNDDAGWASHAVSLRSTAAGEYRKSALSP